jgi:hypothetical protein
LESVFTAAGCWGTFRQKRAPGAMEARLKVLFGTLAFEFASPLLLRAQDELKVAV